MNEQSVVLGEINHGIHALRTELSRANPTPLIKLFQRLSTIRGNFALDLISSIAWAAEVVCGTAATAGRDLNSVELRSLNSAVDSMDRARHTAFLSVAA
jgi:hypothetical protein